MTNLALAAARDLAEHADEIAALEHYGWTVRVGHRAANGRPRFVAEHRRRDTMYDDDLAALLERIRRRYSTRRAA